MLFKTFLPIAFGTSNIANIAVSTSVLINYMRIQRDWKFVFKRKVRRNPVRYFEDYFQFTERKNVTKYTGKILFHQPRSRSKKRQNHHNFLFRNCVNWQLILVDFVEKSKNALVDEAIGIGITTEYLFQFFHFCVQRRIRVVDLVRPEE